MSEVVTEVISCESSTTDYGESEIYVKDKVSAMVKDYFDNPDGVSEEAITRHSHYAIKLADGKNVENLIEYIIEVAYLNLLRSYQGDLTPSNHLLKTPLTNRLTAELSSSIKISLVLLVIALCIW